MDLPVRCECGGVKGSYRRAAKRYSNRVICYCDDCQAFAQWLGRSECLDAHGGTDILQIPPAALTIDERSTIGGVCGPHSRTQRWYCTQCGSPVANTVRGLPFIGLFRIAIHANDHELDDAVGRPVASIFGEFATGSAALPRGIPLGLRLRSAGKLIGWFFRGWAAPNPFIDADGGRYPLSRCNWTSSGQGRQKA